MRKLLLPAFLVLFGTASAETRYEFSYTGLHNIYDLVDYDWEPDSKYLGTFTVEDSNGDGTYQKDEVLEFSIGVDSSANLFDVLHAFENEYGSWGYLSQFNYTPGGQLTFWGEHQYLSADSVMFSHQHYRNSYGITWYETDPRTIISVVQVVPEPSSLMMFGGGISALMLAARRRRLQIST